MKMHVQDRRKEDVSERGSILLLALWTLFFLATLALAVGAHVSAGLRRAGALKNNTTAYYLACAGVERAIMAIEADNTNEWAGQTSEYWSKDNDSIDCGLFSVMYMRVKKDGVETNFGVTTVSCRTNINNLSNFRSLLESKLDADKAAGIAEGARQYRKDKKELTLKGVNGKFESVYELLLVPGVNARLFKEIEPYITVYGGNCFEGIAEGKAGARESADSRITFVFDRGTGKILYWHEH